MFLSEKGKDFDGKELSEDNLPKGTQVMFKKTIYITGEVIHTRAQLVLNEKVEKVIPYEYLQLIK